MTRPEPVRQIYFEESAAERLRPAVIARFAVPGELVYLGDSDMSAYRGPEPLVMIHPGRPGDGFSCELWAGGDVAPELDVVALARTLCAAADTSAMLDLAGLTPDTWLFVDADGNAGVVATDSDAAGDGSLVITCARQPIPGHPEWEVVADEWNPLPDWDRGR